MGEYIPKKNQLAKRVVDVLTSLLLLLLSTPFFLLCFLALFLEHCIRLYPFAPLVYRDRRISSGKSFSMYKFNIFNQRTVDLLKESNTFIHTKSLEHNGDLTYIGYLLKQIYIDELPQLVNVLCGDMSLVGPRPLNLEVFETVRKKRIATQTYIRAGITGNFQSQKENRRAKAHELDLEYFEKYKTYSPLQLILLDAKIVFKTIKVVLRAKGI